LLHAWVSKHMIDTRIDCSHPQARRAFRRVPRARPSLSKNFTPAGDALPASLIFLFFSMPKSLARRLLPYRRTPVGRWRTPNDWSR
jgi:hypothetical protein